MEERKNFLASKKDMCDIINQCTEELKEVLNENIIDKIEFSTEGSYMTLNKEHFGIKMSFNADDYEDVPYAVMAGKDFEKEEMKIVKKVLSYLPENAVCFDVGANIGWYTLHIKKEHPKMEVYSFEPSPITYERLCNNMLLNGLSKEKCINAGFFKEEGEMEFYYDPNGSGASSLVNLRERENVRKIVVSMTEMDKWRDINQVDGPEFIKCDVEGAELFVYQGGLETIKQYKPIIFSEMLRKWSAKFGYHPNDIIQLLSNVGYKCFVIGENDTLKSFGLVDEETIETNYFFLHSEKHANMIQKLCK